MASGTQGLDHAVPVHHLPMNGPTMHRIHLAVTLMTSFTSSVAFAQNCSPVAPVDTTQWPHYTIVDISTPNVDLCGQGVKGTGTLISRHCAITAAHVVFHQPDFNSDGCDSPIPHWHNVATSTTLVPGMSTNGNLIVAPYGTRQSIHRSCAVNWREGNRSKSNRLKYDYGVVRFVCPFPGLNTFLCIDFDNDVSQVKIAGYGNVDGNTSTLDSSTGGLGNVTRTVTRKLESTVNTTNGHSGSSVRDTNDEVIVALSTYGNQNVCNGGPRMSKKNEDTIRTWMRWVPSEAQFAAASCVNASGFFPWIVVFDQVMSSPEMLIPMAELNLIAPIDDFQFPHSKRSMQIIEGEFYEWLEFRANPQDPNSPRFLEMLAPEPHLLGLEEARALLSASRNWAPRELAPTDAMEFQSDPNTIPAPIYWPEGEEDAPDDEELDEGSTEETDQEDPTDINNDGVTNAADLGQMLGNWGLPGAADIDQDGTTDSADLGLLLSGWTIQLP